MTEAVWYWTVGRICVGTAIPAHPAYQARMWSSVELGVGPAYLGSRAHLTVYVIARAPRTLALRWPAPSEVGRTGIVDDPEPGPSWNPQL